jgi:hypothetical protein
MSDPVYIVNVTVTVPVKFVGKVADFEQPMQTFEDAALNRVESLLPAIVTSVASSEVRNILGDRYYADGVDMYTGKVPEGIETPAPERTA